MNIMKHALTLLLLAVVPFAANAQSSKIPQRIEIVESDNYSVFYIPKDDQRTYYLSVGALGVGNEIIQFNVDPIHELFIPLGYSLSEAITALDRLKALCKEKKGASIEMPGCLALGFPNEHIETVSISPVHSLLERSLEFQITRDKQVRATYITQSTIRSLLSGVKIYRKLHPKEDVAPNEQTAQ